MSTPHPPAAGRPERLAPDIRRILAPNPSPMTFTGTNTYLVGTGAVTVIDPGPDDGGHRAAILSALDPDERIVRILVTHPHLDHSAGARTLAAACGAPVCAFGPPEAGRSATMTRLAGSGLHGGGEGVDRAFVPDVRLPDGTSLEAGGARLTALWTPGHMASHLSFALGDTVFTGDVVMGWATTLISPPDGDLLQFLDSCRRLAGLGARRFLPAHGDPVDAPRQRCEALIAHREARHGQIRQALASGPASPAAIAAALYPETAGRLRQAAERNVLAHLIALCEAGEATADALSISASFRLSGPPMPA